ncbi:MAG: acyl carrier protein [Proteobacteria bacterium]|nr:acyl carrier protein [Pseudomonadota bacterium]MBU1650510.1 acyl carrier protein [Pseudomonadota bacterium]
MKAEQSEVVKIIHDANTQIDFDKLSPEIYLRDIGADSLDMMTILLGLQDKYGIEIPDEAVEKLNSVAAICDFINNT